jgi:hydroxyacid-oxoacid transhydrogenase
MTVPDHETVFTLEATPIKFGRGAVDDAGWELERLGVGRALLVTDPGLRAIGHPDRVREVIEGEGIEVVVYDRARIEPTLESFQDAADFALEANVDGFVSVGGGSSIDTAKVANLITTHPAPVMEYVNPPVGGGRRPPSPLRPHLAIPTTSGTGSEATTVAVLDVPQQHVKSGISHRYLRPSQGIVDPELVRTLPPEVASSTGLDVICHAAESYLSRPYEQRTRPATPDDRPPYQGSNPIADVWSAKALEYGGRYLRRAVADGDDLEARRDDARRHHGGRRVRLGRRAHTARLRVSDREPPALLPGARLPRGPSLRPPRPLGDRHGARGVPLHLRGDAGAPPPRRRIARRRADRRRGPDALPDVLRRLMRDIGAPRGIAALGYTEDDVRTLVEGTMKQQRLLVVSPRDVAEIDIAHILNASMTNW